LWILKRIKKLLGIRSALKVGKFVDFKENQKVVGHPIGVKKDVFCDFM
jgi:hypothetical protein